MTRFSCRSLAGVSALVIALILAGCAGPSEQRRAQQPLLEDRAMLFDGAVELAAMLAPPFQRGADGGGPGGEGRHHRGGGGGRRRGPGGFEGVRPDEDEIAGGGRMGMRPGFALLTHRLTLRFTNRHTESVSFRIEDVQSLLGTVAVHPDRLTLEPGQTAELDPILGSPGAFFEQFDVAVLVKRNNATETVRLTLRRAAQ